MSALSLRRALLGMAIVVGNVSLSAAPAIAQASYTTYTRYDALGRVTGTIAPDPDGAGTLRIPAVRNSYDPQNNLLKVESGSLGSWQGDTVAPANWPDFAIQSTVERTYDAVGRKLTERVRGSDGVVASLTQFSYLPSGALECTAQRMNPAAFASPPASACTLGAAGTQGDDRITRNVHVPGAPGVIEKVQKAYGTPLQQDYATYTYSANWKVLSMTDARGFKASMTYDGYDRQARWYFPDKLYTQTPSTTDYEEYTYDPNGNRTNLRKRDGRSIGYGYDALNRMVSKGSSYMADIAYSYDLRGLQLTAKFATSGQGVTNGYNGFGEPTSSTITMNGLSAVLGRNYDPNGNRVNLIHPDGATFTVGHDNLNRAKDATWAHTAGTRQFLGINYDNAGRRAAMIRSSSSTTYSYDGVSRLGGMGQNFVGGAGNANLTFGYNPASQMVSQTLDNDGYAWTGHVAVDRNYAVNGLNQYQTAGPAVFCHDANGNLTADGSSVYKYDLENRLIEKRTQVGTACPTDTSGYTGTLQASLVYDPLGRLFETSGGASGITRFVYDGDQLAAEYDQAGVMKWRYFFGPNVDEPIIADLSGRLDCNNTRFLHLNHQGSMVAAADCAGNRTTVATYDEYGIPSPNNWGRFQYTGQAWIPELGMYYYKARIYSPTLGRFLQTDPIGYDDQVNLYAYVGNDPVNGRDPTGTYVCGGTKEECGAAERAINDARKGAQDQSLSRAERKSLERIANFYGKAGVKNGVAVIFAAPKEIQKATRDVNAGATVVRGPKTGVIAVVLPKNFQHKYSNLVGNPSSIGRDMRTWTPAAERANTVAHEGQHGADMRDGRAVSEDDANAAGRAVSRSMGTFPHRELPADDD